MITVDIVTPTKKVVENAKATSVKLPGARGELEILSGHTELLTLLSTGILSIINDGKEKKFAVSYGFAEVRDNKVLVLAETIEEASQIDKMRAQAAQRKAEQALLGVLQEEEFRKHQLKLQRSIIRQSISV